MLLLKPAKRKVEVADGDDEERLAKRVLEEEVVISIDNALGDEFSRAYFESLVCVEQSDHNSLGPPPMHLRPLERCVAADTSSCRKTDARSVVRRR